MIGREFGGEGDCWSLLCLLLLFIYYVIVEIKLEFCWPAVFSGVWDQRERGKTSGHYGQHFCAGCRNVRRRFESD